MATTTPQRTPSKDGGGGGGNNHPKTPPSQKKRLDGLFQDGAWFCNCQPRKQSILLQVRRDKPSKGRWFFKCASHACDFFLWEEDARKREDGFPSASGRDSPVQGGEELPPQPKTPGFVQRRITSYGIQRGESAGDVVAAGNDDEDAPPDSPCPPAGRKRTRDVVVDDDDDGDDAFSDLGSDVEKEMAALADVADTGRNVRRRLNPAEEEPQTPVTTRTVHGLPTPSTARTLFPSEPQRPQKSVSFEEDTPSKTPTATPAEDGTTPATPATPEASHDPTAEVMALLSGHGLDASVLASVRGVLARHAQRAHGVALGRDFVRSASRDKDARIAKLQERVAALETKEWSFRVREREMNDQITKMKAGLARMYQEN